MKGFITDFVLGFVGKGVLVFLAAAALTLAGLMLAVLAVLLHVKPVTLVLILVSVSIIWELLEWVTLIIGKKSNKKGGL